METNNKKISKKVLGWALIYGAEVLFLIVCIALEATFGAWFVGIALFTTIIATGVELLIESEYDD